MDDRFVRMQLAEMFPLSDLPSSSSSSPMSLKSMRRVREIEGARRNSEGTTAPPSWPLAPHPTPAKQRTQHTVLLREV
eukprot:6176316-Pleurochrysis_carterae.AAC.3